MTTPDPNAAASARLADRLTAARAARFVGRAAELALFHTALAAEEPPFAVLHLHGPGGIGKTTLLGQYAALARAAGRRVLALNGRDLTPTPTACLDELRQALTLTKDESPIAALAQGPPTVLLIDTYEQLAPLDYWLRETLMPQLPAATLTVIAGRHPPDPAWTSDLGWGTLTRVVALRNLRPEECVQYLAAHGIAGEAHAAALAFTHGHPLALTLMADVIARDDGQAWRGDVAPAPVIETLLTRLLDQTPSPRHRRALEICAHVRATSEDVLAAALPEGDATELFHWLRGLAFVEQGPDGLVPHELVRDVIDAEWRWRNADEYRQLHLAIRDYLIDRSRRQRGRDRQRTFFDVLFFHRHHPLMRPFYEWRTLGDAYADHASAADTPFIFATVRRHEGEAAAAIARYWWERQPAAFSIFRSERGEPIGLMANLAFDTISAADQAADPALAAVTRFFARQAPPRPGERVLYHRFWMGNDEYQTAATQHLAAMLSTILWMEDSGLAWSFIAIADPDYWEPMFTHVQQWRTPDAAFTVGGRPYGVFAHDWRVAPVAAWLDALAERELDREASPPKVATTDPALIVLSQPDFAEAARQALRDLHRPAALAANPLTRARLVAGEAGDPGVALVTLVRAAIAALGATPREQRWARVLHHTYVAPAGSQEQAAALLDLPFSTYRRYLAAGVEQVIDWLWRHELYRDRP